MCNTTADATIRQVVLQLEGSTLVGLSKVRVRLARNLHVLVNVGLTQFHVQHGGETVDLADNCLKLGNHECEPICESLPIINAYNSAD